MKKKYSLSRLITVFVLACGLLPLRAAQDADIAKSLEIGDSIPTDKLETLYKNDARQQSEESNADKASWVRTLKAGVIGRDRLLVEIEFDHAPVMDRSSFCLYIDLDDDATTGRDKPGVEGVDIMVVLNSRDGKEPYLSFHSTVANSESTFMRSVWDDNVLYISIETPLEDLKQSRFFFLSQKDESASNFSTPKDKILTIKQDDTALPLLW